MTSSVFTNATVNLCLWEGESVCLSHEPGDLPKHSMDFSEGKGGNTMEKSMDFISYPFLHEKERIVDHEVLTDELASYLGLILAMGTSLHAETEWLMDKVLHLNGSVRGMVAITPADTKWLLQDYRRLKEQNLMRLDGFVYPTGHVIACHYHVARGMAKRVTRNLHLIRHSVPQSLDELIDFSELMTNYLFVCALEINRLNHIDEVRFHSKSYKKGE